jgi:glycosyltransferase involved in cell wall biosynthesis
MKNPKISYAILACVESVELQKLLPFLKENKNKEDEIVILLDDSCYTAGVEELAGKYADTRGHKSLNNDFAGQKNKLIEMCEGDYIFNIDADEMPHKNLMENLHTLLEQNPDTEVFYVPRVNTVEGLTDSHIHEWRWRLNDKGWVNWPDPQMRIHKNIPTIRWKNPVHEILSGHKTFVNLPHEEQWSIYHHKDIKRQEKQNEFYSTI